MRCHACGSEVPELRFCDQCGTRARASAAAAPAAQAPKPSATGTPQGAARERALALLRRGDYEEAFNVLQTIVPLPEADRPLYNALRGVIVDRRTAEVFSAAHAHLDRLEVAAKLSGLGLHEEAIGVLTERLIVSACKGDESFNVASVFAAAGRVPEFLAKWAARRPPEFYSGYARAFDMVNEPKAALQLLDAKDELDDEDYALLFSLRGKLGTLGEVDAGMLPYEQRPRLARALIERGKDDDALAVLEAIPRERWTKREYAAALGTHQRLGRFERAQALFKEVQAALTLKDAADLHYGFAVFCEGQGRLDKAKGIYRNLLDLLGDFRDAAARLKNLES